MLPNYLASIKSSGIYRFVWDKSEMPGAPAQILRLVVGYSEKGPFNTPVYVTSEAEFKQIFGGISKKMERYGVWFHRLAIQALKKGPILCLNLKNFEGGTDDQNKVEFTTFNPDETIFNMSEGDVIENLKMAVKDLYNTDRFWKLEPEHLEDLEIDGILPTGKKQGYITITTTDSKDTSVTIFMRGYEPTGYDVPFREWYSVVLNGEEVPTYLEGHENDLVSQYFAQLFVFRGKFTPEIAASDKLAKFFNVNGNEVTLKPYIENAFGEKVDTLTALAANDASNFIRSYTGILIPDFRDANNITISLDTLVNADNYLHKLMMRLNQDMLYNIDPDDEESFQISDIDTTGWYKGPTATNAMMSLTGIDPVVYGATWVWIYDGITYNSKLTAVFDEDTDTWSVMQGVTEIDTGLEDEPVITTQWNYAPVKPEHQGLAADYYKYNGLTLTSEDDYNLKFSGDEIDKFNKSGIRQGDTVYIEASTSKLVHIVKVSNEEDESVLVQVDSILPTSITAIYKCVGSATFTSNNLAPLYLEGYTFANPKPDSTQQWDKLQWQHHILDTLTNYRGIRLALTNRVDVDYRYLVDTFEGFVENELKSKLTNIVMTKDNTFGLINWPSMKSFSKCKYVSFRDDNQEFLTKYIPMGGNPLKPQSLVFSLPSQENGASWAGYFSALALKDPNTAQRIEIPSAALVSNDFMDKYTKYQPYTIIAGPNRAVIREPGLIGPDFNFSREDLNELEPFGVNCMVYEPRKGTFINSNQTAKQNPVTALSKIHVRELCIYLQDEIEKMLTDYHWDFNTPNLQNRVKDRADVILGQVKNNDGIYDFKNVCDESNNTDDVVNAEMFVISTSIEPAQGAGKMVQELTIYRKGGMSAEYIEQ